MDELKLQLQADRKNTQYNETEGGDKCKVKDVVYFSRNSQGFLLIAYLIKLQGEGGAMPHIWEIRVCLSASRLFDSGTGYKNHPPFTGRLRGIFYISLSLRSGSVFFLTIPDYS